MYDFEKMDKRYLIFGNIFLLANRLQTVMDNAKKDLTAKQWMVLTMLGSFEEPPTLKQLAAMCETSHQNTKEIVNKLEAKGFVNILKDEADKRAMRILRTSKCEQWSKDNEEYGMNFISEMYHGLSEEEIRIMSEAQIKIFNNLKKLGGK